MKAGKNMRVKRSNVVVFLALSVILWINGGMINYLFVYLPDLIKLGIFGLWIGLVCLFKRNFFRKVHIYCITYSFFYVYSFIRTNWNNLIRKFLLFKDLCFFVNDLCNIFILWGILAKKYQNDFDMFVFWWFLYCDKYPF